jgi:hypothetical protein
VSTTDQGSTYIYSLSTQQRGKILILKTDPRLTDLTKRQILYAKYGEGNVIAVNESELASLEGLSVISKYSQEGFNPNLGLFGGGTEDIVSGTITLNPPANLTILNTAAAIAGDGSSVTNVTVQFDDVPGATEYEIDYVSAITSPLPQAVTNLSAPNPTAGSRVINVSWNTISNASNYIIKATSGGSTVYAQAPVTSGSGTITVPSAGTYTVTVTPYNAQGIAGTAASVTTTVS